jgi:putative copper export protein
MTKAAWLLVLTLFLVSASGIVPASIGMFFTSFAILLAMSLLAVAQRKRLVAGLKQGEKITMPIIQKIFLVIFVVLAIVLIFIGGLTKQ